MGEDMKFFITLSAMIGVSFLAGAVTVPAPASAKSDAECRIHLSGYYSTSNPQAQAAKLRAYKACRKQK